MAASRTGPGSREGVTSSVSSKVGPSGVRGLSKTAVTVRWPSSSRASMLSSGPGRCSSTSRGSVSGRRADARTRRNPPGRGCCGGWVVGAQDSLAGAERDCLDHAREPDRLGRAADGVASGGGHDLESRLGYAGGCPALPLPGLVGGVPYRLGRVVRQPEPRRHRRCQLKHRGVRGDHRGDRAAAGGDQAGAAIGVGGVHGDDRAAAERQRAVAADDQVQAHPGRRQQEVGRAVGAGGHQQQYPRSRRRRLVPGW